MGIKGLFQLLAKVAPMAATTRGLSHYKGKRVGIDASLAIFEWTTIGEQRKITNAAGAPINHIQGVVFRTTMLMHYGITPVFVFDGRPPPQKQNVIAARRARPRPNLAGVFDECRRLLAMMGVPVVDAPGEAEAQLALMALAGDIDLVATEDSDALVFGAPVVVRGFKSGGVVTEWNLRAILRCLHLTHAAFVDLCILLGCDYTGKMPGIGPAKALKMIQKHGSINAAGIVSTPAFDYEAARRLFLHPTVAPPTGPPQYRRIDAAEIEALRQHLLARGLAENKIATAMEKLRIFNDPHS